METCAARSTKERTLFWTTLAFFGGFAGVSAYGPIMARLKESLALSPVAMGILAASPVLTGSLLRIPFGAMVDRTGGKKPILILLGLAGLGIACITVLFALIPEPRPSQFPLFLLSGILCGCGIAVFSVGIPTVSYWYPQKSQGTALAIYAGLGNIAPGLFAMLLPYMVVSLGFTQSYLVWLGMLILVLILIYAFMLDAPYFQYREMGIEIDQQALLHTCGQELFPSGRAVTSLKGAVQGWRTWILTFFYFVSFGGFIALTVWLPTYWAELFALSLVKAGLLTALYSITASLFRVLGGVAADKAGGESMVLFAFILIAIGASVMIYATDALALAVAGQMILALGMGLGNAAVFKLVPRYSPTAVGGVAGIVGGLGALGGFAIPPLMGVFVEVSGRPGYSQGFLVFLVLIAISLILFALLRRNPLAR